MEITTSEQDGVLVVAVEGKPAQQLFKQFEQAVPDPARKVCLDLRATKDFLGDDIEDLVRCHNHCEHNGGSLVLAGVPQDLGYVIGILSLDQFFTMIGTVDEATAQLAQASGPMAMTTLRMIEIQRDKIKESSEEDLDPEEAARQMVQQVKFSVRYLAPNPMRVKLLQFFEKLGPAELSVAEAADEIGEPRDKVQEAFDRLAGLRVLAPNRRGLLRYSPGPTTRRGIQAILAMWEDEANRDKMLEWAKGDFEG